MLVLEEQESRLTVLDRTEDLTVPDFAADVKKGLSATPKTLPPIYFYDERGSELFERICALPEYYITRSEAEILQNSANEIAGYSSGDLSLVELGSGSAIKTRFLISALIEEQGELHYLPIDISSSALIQSAKELSEDYPELTISGCVADYETGLEMLSDLDEEQKMIAFLGSNIGNFEVEEAMQLLHRIREQLQPDDYFLIGTDMQKDVQVLEAAYNDRQGVTAQFNLNILRRMNRELGADFDMSRFSHLAFYNAEKSRIEMHIRSEAAQEVYIDELQESFSFAAGETIHTENSHKYSFEQIRAICDRIGFRLENFWQDREKNFSLNLLAPRS